MCARACVCGAAQFAADLAGEHTRSLCHKVSHVETQVLSHMYTPADCQALAKVHAQLAARSEELDKQLHQVCCVCGGLRKSPRPGMPPWSRPPDGVRRARMSSTQLTSQGRKEGRKGERAALLVASLGWLRCCWRAPGAPQVRSQVVAYEALGPPFQALVSTYGRLRAELRAAQQALSTFTELESELEMRDVA